METHTCMKVNCTVFMEKSADGAESLAGSGVRVDVLVLFEIICGIITFCNVKGVISMYTLVLDYQHV